MTDEPKRRVRKVYLLPNLFTAFNMFMGIWAMASVMDGRVEWACWLIFLAVFLDGLDGAVARLTHTQSEFGVHFDSLSDLVSFGVAPAVVANYTLSATTGMNGRLILGMCALYAICGALRLARYNVQMHSTEKKGFVGLPIPAAAGALAMAMLVVFKYGYAEPAVVLFNFPAGDLTRNGLLRFALPFGMLVLAVLMVSELPYPHLGHGLFALRRKMSFDSLVSLIFLGVVIFSIKSDMRVLLLFSLGVVYAAMGPTSLLLHALRPAHAPHDAGTPAPGGG